MVNETDTGETPVDIDLDKFSEEFFNPTAEQPEEVVEEEAEEEEGPEEVETLATEEDEESPEEEEEGDEPDGEEEPEPAPKKKKSAQERFNELTAEKHEERRAKEAALADAAALRREIETLKAGREEKEEATPLREQLPDNAPKPDAKDKDGNPIYELGEFDPNYIRDLTKFTIEEESKAQKAKDAQEEYERGVKAAQAELAQHWAEAVTEAEAEIPTLREDIVTLTNTFESVEPAYGEYLAMTIMQCDAGPEIMHYFSQNIGEAQKIVAAGPAAATLAIGALNAKLARAAPEKEEKRNKKVSAAPTPPEKGARGVHGRQTVRPDTNNLDAFSDMFFDVKK